MLAPKNSQQIFIPGPCGRLDCLEFTTKCAPSGVAIIFHPDPKGGGTYNNKIVQTIAKHLNSLGFVCYCPNLRGVGESDGIHDFGNGETLDAKAIHTFITNKHHDLPLVIAGFSFGTCIASKLAMSTHYHKLILVAPAVTRYEIIPPDVNKTVVLHGDSDEIIDFNQALDWAKIHNQPLICVPNTGHFFHGKLIQLQNILASLKIL